MGDLHPHLKTFMIIIITRLECTMEPERLTSTKANICVNCMEIQTSVLSQLLLLHGMNALTLQIIAFKWESYDGRDRDSHHDVLPTIHMNVGCPPIVLTLAT
jgi:hypothetical protein